MLTRYTVESNGCWQWTGPTDTRGYGKAPGGLGAHRVVFESLCGPIPEGLELDHLCRNRACVNPEHLEPVTHAENMRRSWPARKTHCVNGHIFDEANTYRRPAGRRDCRACIRDRVSRYRQRKAA